MNSIITELKNIIVVISALLIYILTFTANIIARGKQDRSKAENQFAQETGFGILEDLDSFKRIEMDVDGDFSF